MTENKTKQLQVRITFLADIETNKKHLSGFDYMNELDFNLPDTENFKVNKTVIEIGNQIEGSSQNEK